MQLRYKKHGALVIAKSTGVLDENGVEGVDVQVHVPAHSKTHFAGNRHERRAAAKLPKKMLVLDKHEKEDIDFEE